MPRFFQLANVLILPNKCKAFLQKLFLPELAGGEAGVGLEEFVEDRLVGEIEGKDNFLDAFVRVLEEVFGFQNYKGVYPVRGAAESRVGKGQFCFR